MDKLDKIKFPALLFMLVAFVLIMADYFINGGATIISYIGGGIVAVPFVGVALYSVVNLLRKG